MLVTRPTRAAGRSARIQSSTLHQQTPRLRYFNQSSQLLLISRPGIRPQLPYLHATSHFANQSPFQQQIARLLTTERKKYYKDTIWGVIRLTLYGWTALYLILFAWWGWQQEQQEQKTPTPPQWSWKTRWYYRSAKKEQFPSQLQGRQQPDWPEVAVNCQLALKRVEDPAIDGKGTKSALGDGEGDILVEGLGTAGRDISEQPEPWRRGYFELLMTGGLAAEHVEGFVKDTSRNGKVFPPQVVIGPSNPRPQPMPFNSPDEAPREENCVVFYDPPEKFYMKVLTTVGFTSTQKLQAALAYADWLDFKGLPETASGMYEWALDIALEAYHPGDPLPFDRQTGMLKHDSSPVTKNLLTAATSLAAHHAKNGDLAKALPEFLSVLRVQQDLQPPREQLLPGSGTSLSSLPSALSFLSKIIVDNPYPPPPPSGDEPATRSAESLCAEAVTIAHVGEILYVAAPESVPASLLPLSHHAGQSAAIEASSSQIAGLAWTKQAVNMAEDALRALSGKSGPQVLLAGSEDAPEPVVTVGGSDVKGLGEEEKNEAKKTCAQCLEMAMTNWIKMVGRLAAAERRVEIERATGTKNTVATEGIGAQNLAMTGGDGEKSEPGWLGSWGLWNGASRATASGEVASPAKEVGKWIAEAQMVKERSREIRRLLRGERIPTEL